MGMVSIVLRTEGEGVFTIAEIIMAKLLNSTWVSSLDHDPAGRSRIEIRKIEGVMLHGHIS